MRGYLKRIPGLRRAARLLRRAPLPSARRSLLKAMPEGSVCAEIGVHTGDFSQLILGVTRPARLHLIDPWMHQERLQGAMYGGLGPRGQAVMDERFNRVRLRFAREIESGRIVVHRASSADAAAEFDDGYFDWVYIDGNHTYKAVDEDLERYLPKVRPGGWLAGDDYGVEGWWENGVQRAVDDFVARRPGFSLAVRRSQFMIRVPADHGG